MFYKYPQTPSEGNPNNLKKKTFGIDEEGLGVALGFNPIGVRATDLETKFVKLKLRQYSSGPTRRPRFTRFHDLKRKLPDGPDDSKFFGSRELTGTVEALIPVERCSEMIHNGGLILLRNSSFAMTRISLFEGIKCKQDWRYTWARGTKPEQTEVLITDVFADGGVAPKPINSAEAFRACLRVRWLVDSRYEEKDFFANVEWVTSATQARYDRVETLNTLRGTDIDAGILVVRKGVINRHWIKAADGKLYLAVLNGKRLAHPGKSDPRVDTIAPSPPAVPTDVATNQVVLSSKKEILAAIAGN